jgi:pimeloyl-ACP methyl ester carboxylesterase
MTSFVFGYDNGVDAQLVRIEALVRGEGPLVVMVPSLGRGASDFDDLARRLAGAGYKAAAINPRGIGASDGPAARSMSDYARDIAELMKRLSPDGRATLIGHAFGNRVVRATASDHPEAVSSLILLACGGQAPIPEAAARALMDVFDQSLPPEAHIEAVKTAFFAPGGDPEVWRDGWHTEVSRAQQAALRASPFETWAGAGSARMLIIQASDDVIAPVANAQALLSAFPQRTEVVTLGNAGHAMLPEQPEAIAALVIDHLKRSPR